MRKLVGGALLAVVILAGVAMPSTASAHVHGITPLQNLGCTGVDFGTTGANGTDGTPASAVTGGPIPDGGGPIPISLGNSTLEPDEGGFGKASAAC